MIYSISHSISGSRHSVLKTLISAFLLLVLLSGCSGGKGPKAPDFSLNNPDGSSYSLSDFRGKMLILNFWATWCPPCKKEIPDFIELYDKYSDQGLVILGVSVDQGGWLITKEFADKSSINYPVVMANRDIVYKYGSVQSIPTTFIIDPEGRIAGEFVGYRPKAVWEEQIRSILKL